MPIRVYADTSVYGGVFDPGIDAPSGEFFAQFKTGRFQAGVVTPKWATDALHVALASAGHCRCMVSWNFRHIVHFDKIPLYHGVNLINGFDSISINSPAEVIAYET